MKLYDTETTEYTEMNSRIKLCQSNAIALLCGLCFLCE
jgi:hypothetical protein